MCYGEVLKMEQNVAFNMVNDKEFEIGVKKVLGVPYHLAPKTAEGNRLNPGFAASASEAKVDSFFTEHPLSPKFELEVVENALLPTREFYERYPDSLRVYLNETLSLDPGVRDAVGLEVKDLLIQEGIDLRNKTVTVPYMREVVMQKIKNARYQAEQFRRAMLLAGDKKLRDGYFARVDKELKKFEDKDFFFEQVNGRIQDIFEQAYFGRLAAIYDKSREAHSLQKRRLVIRLKKFLMKNRLLTYFREEQDKLAKQVQSMSHKQVHLTEPWDVSIRDTEHPDL